MSILDNLITQLTLNSFHCSGELCVTVNREQLLEALENLRTTTWNGAITQAAEEAKVSCKMVGVDFEVEEARYFVDKDSILKLKTIE